MKAILALALLVTSAFAGAQDAKRVDAIWEAVNDRISTQIDVWFEDGEFPMAIQLLRVQADMKPHDYDVVTNLGWMLENVHEWDLALQTYKDYRKNNPNDPDAALAEADYWFRKKKYAPVIPLLDKITNKAHPNAFRILAHSYERLNKLKESQQTWKRYIALKPTDLTAKNNLRRVERKIAEKGGAGP
jgi:tetratricopeptide (TPR) repeat protein